MRRCTIFRSLMLVAILAACLPLTVAMPVAQAHGSTHIAVTTRSYDTNRTGANLQETILNPAKVKALNAFGKLYERAVDGQIYAQPLYLPDVSIPNKGTHNIVYVATQKNMVYAFDADDPAASAALWQVNLGAYAESVVNGSSDFGNRYNSGRYADIQPNVGITGTPVIDIATGTMYVVTFERGGTTRPFTYKHRLHALDVATGAEKLGGPIAIGATFPGSTTDAVGGIITFQSVKQLQRSALLLSKGIVYVAFAGYADTDPYHGWILGYDAATLAQRYVFNTTPNSDVSGSQPDENDGEGGIWMSGQGLAADAAGDIYFVTGNGNFTRGNGTSSGGNYGSSVVRVRPPAPTPSLVPLEVQTYFTPYNYSYLNMADLDLGVTAAVLIPGTNYVVAGSKEGKLYLLDRTNMGGLDDTQFNDYNAVQTFLATNQLGDHIHGSPVFWNNRLYLWSEKDRLRAFAFDKALPKPFGATPVTAVMTGSYQLSYGMPGGIVSLSANGNDTTSGIVWATTPIGDANQSTRLGELRAYDASANGQQDALWSSADNPSRDQVGNFAKFNPPMVADGKVFVGSFSSLDDPATPGTNEFRTDKLVVYGLLKPAIVDQPEGYTVTYNTSAQLTVRATGRGPLQYQWYQGLSGDTSTPVAGATAATYTTAPLTTPTRFWVNVTNQVNGQSTAQSESALIGVKAIETQVALTNSPATTAVYGQPVTIGATVSKVAPNPTVLAGTVTFYDSGVNLGSASIDSNGVATLTGNNLTVGTHMFNAAYGGVAGIFTQATSANSLLTVGKASTSTTVTIAPTAAVAGQSLTLTAQVAAVAPSTLMPGGSVQFMSGSTVLGTATLDASGQAQLVAPAAVVGAFAVSATYTGTSNWLASTSPAQSATISKADTTTALTFAAPQVVIGETVVMTAQVAVTSPGPGIPSGSVQFISGSTLLGTAQLDATGQARLALPIGTTGVVTVSAGYIGDTLRQPSQSTSQSLTVGQAKTTTVLTIVPTQPVAGQSVTFSVHVAMVAPATGIPTGSVQFMNGTIMLGTVELDANGQAQLVLPADIVTTAALSANYLGSPLTLPSRGSVQVTERHLVWLPLATGR